MLVGAHWGGSEVQLHPWEFISPGPGERLAIRACTHKTTISGEVRRSPGHSRTCHSCCPRYHQFLQRCRQHTGMQNASALLSICLGEWKSRGFMVSPSHAPLPAGEQQHPAPAAPSPGSAVGARPRWQVLYYRERGKAPVLENKVTSGERHHRSGPPQPENAACSYQMQGSASPPLHNLSTHWSKLSCLIFSIFLILISKSKCLLSMASIQGE